ncbi:hypothetical protein FQA39_LY09916 [Lamprigera yunnana]|nr:hypothetical protein FQA39_LY09916 [Lamprigera yunnana]
MVKTVLAYGSEKKCECIKARQNSKRGNKKHNDSDRKFSLVVNLASRKISVCRLKRVELIYELTCRRFEMPESVTVDALRKSVCNILKVEVDSSFSSVEYSVSFSEDEKALNECVTELVSILETFSEESYARANSLWAHAESRCKRMLLGSNKENFKRNRLLLTLAELKSDFECKVKEFRCASLRAGSCSPKVVGELEL